MPLAATVTQYRPCKPSNPQLVTPQGADIFCRLPFMTSFWVLVYFGVIGLPRTAVRCISYKDSKPVHGGSSSVRLWSQF
ncbi:sodium:solute symporter family transporter [Escherichia coli]